MKQTIAVIGIENKRGMELAKSFAKGNTRLLFYSEDLQTSHDFLKQLLNENPGIDAEILDCKVTASWEADIIIAAVPDEKIAEIAGQIKDVACQKIIITPDPSSAENLSILLPHCKIVTIGENFVISGKDNEAVEAVLAVLQNAA